jgi:hypothetical protein
MRFQKITNLELNRPASCRPAVSGGRPDVRPGQPPQTVRNVHEYDPNGKPGWQLAVRLIES